MGSYQHVSNLLDVVTFLLKKMDQTEAHDFDFTLIVNNLKTHSDIIEKVKKGCIEEVEETDQIENLFHVISFLLSAGIDQQSKINLVLNQFKLHQNKS